LMHVNIFLFIDYIFDNVCMAEVMLGMMLIHD